MSLPKKILFIINPISGVGKKNTIPPLIEKLLDTSAFEWKIKYTAKRKHAAIIAQQEHENYDAIIAVGGDGSVNEVGSALIGSNCALGIIPCGSGNGLARHLNIPLAPEEAIKRIANFKQITIDTGIVNDTPFIGTCGFGFDAYIAHKFDSFGKRGFLSYARLVTSEYSKYKAPVFKVKVNGITVEKEVVMCSVANSSQFGNGFTISPNSDIQDGRFELVFLERFSWLKAPQIARKFFSKSIHSSKYFSSITFDNSLEISVPSKENSFYHIDGEPISSNGYFKISVKPQSLNII